jgi:hypothetical protein
VTYGDFPIFTRRYPFHGLENFAFDLLLGKPCLIVARHDSFKDGGAALTELIEKLEKLNCRLRWPPLGEAIRRACRHAKRADADEVETYATELLIDNSRDQAKDLRIRKRDTHGQLVSEVLRGEKPIMWTTGAEQIVFCARVPPRIETRFRVNYLQQARNRNVHRSLRFDTSVALRRILCEFRDENVVKSRFLSVSSKRLRTALRKVV